MQREPVDDFVNVFSQRVSQLAWFLGAGASAASGIPTANAMIADFRTSLFCNATGLARRDVDASDPVWAQRMDRYFGTTGQLPAPGDPSEYSSAFEAVHPDPADRRRYIERVIRSGTTTFGHGVLGSMIVNGDIRCVFTTNFDPLIEQAVTVAGDVLGSHGATHVTVADIETADRATRCLQEDSWPLVVKLHGDYRSEHLKNVAEELRDQDARMRSVLTRALSAFGLVVVGYSGRDASIMEALSDAMLQPGALPAGVWWVVRPGEELLGRVRDLMHHAERNDVGAHLVEVGTFDELAGHLERSIELPQPLIDHILARRPSPRVTPVALPASGSKTLPAVRCSALEITAMPTRARRIQNPDGLSARDARRRIKQAEVWATVAERGDHFAAFGSDAQLEEALRGTGCTVAPGDVVALDPLARSVDRGLLYDAVARAASRETPLSAKLNARGHVLFVRRAPSRNESLAAKQAAQLRPLQRAYSDALTGTVPSTDLDFHEAVTLRMECWDDRWWLVFEPQTYIRLPLRPRPGAVADLSLAEYERLKRTAGDWRRERWANRYNGKWNQIIAAWSSIIAPEPATELTAHRFHGSGENATFVLAETTAWSSPLQTSRT